MKEANNMTRVATKNMAVLAPLKRADLLIVTTSRLQSELIVSV